MAKNAETEAKARKRGKWLCRAGWATFGLSLLLPAVRVFEPVSGWDCFRTVFEIAWATLRGQETGMHYGWAVYYSGFAAVNMALLTSPLWTRQLRRDLRRLRRGAFLLGAATLYTLSYLILGLFNDADIASDLHVGYYAWLLSFALVTAGTFQLAKGNVKSRTKTPVKQQGARMTWTAEEMAALRELEDYLHGVERPAESQGIMATPEPQQEEEVRLRPTQRRFTFIRVQAG